MPGGDASAGKILIWPIPLHPVSEHAEADWSVLSKDERDRALRFRDSRHRVRWIRAHGALRHILGLVTECPPQTLVFENGKYGKPRIAGPGPAAGWHFNLSHSHGMALVAATTAGPLGVDIEHVRDLKDMDAVARRVFCDREHDDYAALCGASRTSAFFNGWTRKESIIKATGRGFSQPLKSIDVTLKPDDDAAIRSYAGDDPAGWYLRALHVAAGYAAAVAIRCSLPLEVMIRGDDECTRCR